MHRMPPFSWRSICGELVPSRCHGLAQFGDPRARREAPQRHRCMTEEPFEAHREMAVAREPSVERNEGEFFVAANYGVQREGEALARDIGVNGSPRHLAKRRDETATDARRRRASLWSICRPERPRPL